MKRFLALVLLWATSVAAFAQITYTDYSGTIATGGTSQTLAVAGNGRVRIAILNPATETENLCVNLTSAASCTAGTSWVLQSGQSIVIDSTELVTVVAATTGHKYVAKAGVGAGFAANGGGSGGGVSGAITASASALAAGSGVDGWDLTQGAKADAKCAGSSSTCSVIAILKTLLDPTTQLPTVIGVQAAAASLGIALSTEDVARLGILTETAPATDTASSGLNGRLQRVAQRLTSLIALFPATLGAATPSTSLAVAEPDGAVVTGTLVSANGDLSNMPVDMTGYECVSWQVTSAAGTLTPTQSIDGTTYFGVPGFVSTNSGAAGAAATSTVTGLWREPRIGRYFKLTVTSQSGTNTAQVLLSKIPCNNVLGANVSNTLATTTAHAEDAAAVSADVGSMNLGVRRDSLAVSTNADADYSEQATNKWGATLTANYQQHAKTYSATVNVAAAASATDIATICGQATTPSYVTKVSVSGQQTTAGQVDMLLIKRSTADTGGTSGSGTAIPHDSGDGAANSAVLGYTANPTTGTAVGTLRRVNVPVGGATSLTNAVTELAFGSTGKGILLKTTSECLAVNLNGVTVTGGTFDVMFEWVELP
jgi:hypothetical protein